MKHYFISVFSLVLLSACFVLPLHAQTSNPVTSVPGSLDQDFDPFEIDQLLMEIKGPSKPFISGDYAIFTADKNARYVGIAFDFENFRNIHKFQLRTIYDAEYNAVDSYYFYILKLPKTVQQVNYRLVIDGLWTTDPLNTEKSYSSSAGLILSKLDAKRYIPEITETVQKRTVKFVYKGESGQKIRLGGSFTNWDSWIYEMQEVKPGLYELNLPLPPGTYQYAFFTGINSMIDTTNPVRCYTQDGKAASQITVN